MSIQQSLKRDFLESESDLLDYDLTRIEIKTSYARELSDDVNAFISFNIDDLN